MSKGAKVDDRSFLVLGWQVTSDLEPRYWTQSKAKVGRQSTDDLTRILASTIANHTAIIAQSGSGKSFFLGRLIEEIMLRTRSRCLVLDPNADFRRIAEVEDAALWRDAAYKNGRGKLPHEASRNAFSAAWKEKEIRIRGAKDGNVAGKGVEALELPWSSVSVDFLAEELDATQRSDLSHCHAVVRDVETLLRLRLILVATDRCELIGTCEELFQKARATTPGGVDALLEARFNFGQQISDVFAGKTGADLAKQRELLGVFGLETAADLFLPETLGEMVTSKVAPLRARVVTASRYVPERVEHFYFSKVREYESTGILRAEKGKSGLPAGGPKRLEVLDIPSIKSRASRLLAINTVIETEWIHARTAWNLALQNPGNQDERVPTFIVVDEAHNLIPADPLRGKAEGALREQFRTIVAEGRKYGLFLILVSQRPDKLDPLVLSECENKAVMKLSSRSVIDVAKRMLGLDDIQPRLLEKCLEFKTGRVLLVGPWVPDGPQITYGAARRTVEGGRNLRDDFWAKPAQRARATPPPTRRKAKRRKKKEA